MKASQLQICPVNSKGELGSPIKYPVGCVHRSVSDTCVLIFHPDDRRPDVGEADDEWSTYELSYATHSCPHGLVVEYVEVDVPE